MKELIAIQAELVAPKNKKNDFGGFRYRSCEGILEAVKPLLKKYDCVLWLSDSLQDVAGRVYVVASATIKNAANESVTVTAMAQDSGEKKGMDAAQVTGAASSYARKYALNGLFLIDDVQDPDTEAFYKQQNKQAKKGSISPQDVAKEYLMQNEKALQYYFSKYPHNGDIDHFSKDELIAIYNELVKAKKI